MRRFRSLVRSAALEALAEPLSAVAMNIIAQVYWERGPIAL